MEVWNSKLSELQRFIFVEYCPRDYYYYYYYYYIIIIIIIIIIINHLFHFSTSILHGSLPKTKTHVS